MQARPQIIILEVFIMKIKLTNKQLEATNKQVIRIGYCGAQYLLRGLNAYAYNKGVYGWNWDAYDIGGGVCVCTGYRNLTGARVKYDDLEVEAEKAIGEYWAHLSDKSAEERANKRIAELRAELINRALA